MEALEKHLPNIVLLFLLLVLNKYFPTDYGDNTLLVFPLNSLIPSPNQLTFTSKLLIITEKLCAKPL